MSSTLNKATRFAKVAGAGAHVGLGALGNRLIGEGAAKDAALFRAALGGLKGPLMKVAQLLASIPNFLHPDMAAELATLQADAPAMGWPFVRRRMRVELGENWQDKFHSFEKNAAAAASLGQVHKATSLDGEALALKLQYPDMEDVVRADLAQLKLVMSMFERFGGAVSTHEAFEEIKERLLEELDYEAEARNMGLYAKIFEGHNYVHVPHSYPGLSTKRLLSMNWLEGERFLSAIETRGQDEKNQIAENMFRLWYLPFYHYGVLHGDPHLGNYTVREDSSINLLDFGCIRIFEPQTIRAVLLMYEALRDEDESKADEAYRLWGFENISKETREILHLWARFVYGPFLEDKVQALHETNSTQKGREMAGKIYEALQKSGQVSIPRPFVMIDRASIGLGGVFLRLGAELNWHRLFTELSGDFSEDSCHRRRDSLGINGL